MSLRRQRGPKWRGCCGAIMLLALGIGRPANAQVAVDLHLLLAVDASGSVDYTRFELQRRGYVAAFRSPQVLQAIRGGENQYAPLPGVPALRDAVLAHQRDFYGLEPEDVLDIIEFEPAFAVKITLRRPWPSGAVGESDVYGAQQHVPLAGHAVEWPETA